MNCIRCAPRCGTCNNADSCLTCRADGDPQREGIALDCVCKDGYYTKVEIDALTGNVSSANCQKCDPKCLTCSGAPDKCVIENTNYVEGGCSAQCESCSGSKDNCTECA